MSRSRSPSPPPPSRKRSRSPSPTSPRINSTHGFPAKTLGTTVKKKAISIFETMMNSSAIIYGTVLIVSILGGGFVIRLYGETCGLKILEPSTWMNATVTIGSSWCKSLNLAGSISTNIVEHLWFHMFGVVVTCLIAYLPGKLKNLYVRDYH